MRNRNVNNISRHTIQSNKTNVLHLDATVKISNISACGKAEVYVAMTLQCISTCYSSLSLLLLWIQNYQFILFKVLLQWDITCTLFPQLTGLFTSCLYSMDHCYTSTLFHTTQTSQSV